MNKRFVTKIALPLVVLVLIFSCWIVFIEKITINYYFLIASILIYMIVVVLRSYKLKTIAPLLTTKDSITYTSCGQLISAFVPGRAGELILSTFLKLKFKLDISRLLPTLFVDKLTELFFVVVYFFVVGILFYRSIIERFIISLNLKINWGLTAVIIGALFILAIIFARRFSKSKRFNQIFENIKRGLAFPVTNPVAGLKLFFTSAAVLLIEYFYLYLVFKTFSINITYSQIVIIHSIGMVIGIITLIPGGQGTTELSMIAVLLMWGFQTKEVLFPLLASKLLTYAILTLFSFSLLSEAIAIVKNRKRRKLGMDG